MNYEKNCTKRLLNIIVRLNIIRFFRNFKSIHLFFLIVVVVYYFRVYFSFHSRKKEINNFQLLKVEGWGKFKL